MRDVTESWPLWADAAIQWDSRSCHYRGMEGELNKGARESKMRERTPMLSREYNWHGELDG